MSFTHSCKVNELPYQCEIDSAASDIFLSKAAAVDMHLRIESQSESVTLGDRTTVPTIEIVKATARVGAELSEEEIHVLDNTEDTGVLTIGRTWGKRHQPSLDWRDYSMVRTRPDGTTVRIMPKGVKPGAATKIKPMLFERLAKELKKGNCELYMARLMRPGTNGADESTFEIAHQVKFNEE